MPKVKRSSIILILFVVLLAGTSLGGWYYFKSKATDSQPTESIEKISVEKLVQEIIDSRNPLIIDLRPGVDFAAGHIPDAASLPYFELQLNTKRLKTVNNLPTVLVCENDQCEYLTKAWHIFKELNFSDVKVLSGGFAAYQDEGLAVVSDKELIQKDLAALLKTIKVPEVTAEDFNGLAKKSDPQLQLIDTRTSFEFIAGFIPGSINIPLHGIETGIDKQLIDKTKPVYIYDRVGNRALIAAQALIQKGYTHTYNIKGGLEAWKKAGFKLDIPKGDGSDFKELMPLLSTTASQ